MVDGQWLMGDDGMPFAAGVIGWSVQAWPVGWLHEDVWEMLQQSAVAKAMAGKPQHDNREVQLGGPGELGLPTTPGRLPRGKITERTWLDQAGVEILNWKAKNEPILTPEKSRVRSQSVWFLGVWKRHFRGGAS